MIKVTLGEVKTQEINSFPKLMIRKNEENYAIILAISKKGNDITGVVVATDYNVEPIGDYSSTFNASVFSDYNEPITLQNL